MSTPQPALLPSQLFDQAHLGLALLDEKGRINWMNPALANLLESDTATLLGRSADDLPEKSSQLLFGDASLVNLLSGGEQRWLRREVHTQSENTLLVFQDITEQQRLDSENQRLRQQVQDLKLTDDLTGLPNKRAITQALELQISRSRRYQNPLSLVLAHVGLDDEQIRTLQTGVEPLVLGVSRYLRDRLRWVDQIGKWGERGFVAILPETGAEDAQRLASAIVDEHAEQGALGLKQGIASWQKGDGARQLLGRAAEALAEADAVANE